MGRHGAVAVRLPEAALSRERATQQEPTQLEAIGKPDPKNVMQYFGWSRALRQNVSAADAAWFKDMLATAKANGETDEHDQGDAAMA